MIHPFSNEGRNNEALRRFVAFRLALADRHRPLCEIYALYSSAVEAAFKCGPNERTRNLQRLTQWGVR
jgi:hypothetical protein